MDNNKSYKILFVDDDIFIQEMYGIKFAQTNHDIKFAKSADEAEKILKEGFVPDVIVFDVIMPGVQGFDFIENIKEKGLIDFHPTLIALTNQNEATDYDRAKAVGVHEYLVKANHIPSEVVALIESAVEKYGNNN